MSTHRSRLLLLITKANWGGAQQYVYDLAVSLREKYDVVVAVGQDGPLVARLQEEGVRVERVPHLARNISTGGDVRAWREITALFRREHPDIVHLNSSKAAFLGAIAARLMRVPRVVYTAHGWAFNERRAWWQRLLFQMLHGCIVYLAHHTIAVSKGMRAQLRIPGTQRRMTVVYPGRALPALPDRATARQALAAQAGVPFDEAQFVVGTIAELHPTKRVEDGIDAFVSLAGARPHLQYVIAGEGELRAQLQARIAASGFAPRVHLLGHVANAAHLLPAFDVLLLPSHSEAFGYVLLEAGQAGVPVVATCTGGIPDIVQHEHSGTLVPVGDVEALAAAIAHYEANPKRCRAHGRALRRVVQRFSLKRMVAGTVAVYEQSRV